MGYGIKLKVWGDRACFSRPEMKVERVSYDVMTPSAARGILEAIHWKPAIKWVIDKLHVLNEIRFAGIRRNEVKSIISESKVSTLMKKQDHEIYLNTNEDRAQRATLFLTDVAYIIEAHFEMTEQANEDTPEKHYSIFFRRAKRGQCFHQPYFGCREFPVQFELLSDEKVHSFYSDTDEKDLGWMLLDIDFKENQSPKFFRAKMCNGIIEVPKL